MVETLLVSAAELEVLIADRRCVVVDCRFDLSDPEWGREDWLDGHVPGAAYANLDRDLSSPVRPDTGRHPLPDAGQFAQYLASIGWTPGTLLVAYDEGPNAIAARLWWLMRYFRQPSALLDGGLAMWMASGRDLEAGEPDLPATDAPDLVPDDSMILGSEAVRQRLDAGSHLLLDARSGERFRGEVEPLDARAGHIPGACSRPLTNNIERNFRFKQPDELRAEFNEQLGNSDAGRVIHSCGSGVTACHNLFAMELAGLGGSRLYPGSWSEWIRDPERPIATGP